MELRIAQLRLAKPMRIGFARLRLKLKQAIKLGFATTLPCLTKLIKVLMPALALL